MLDEECLGDPVGNGAVADEIKKVEVNGFGLICPLEATFDQGAGGAAGTVFEDELGAGGGFLPNFVQLGFRLQGDPIHTAR